MNIFDFVVNYSVSKAVIKYQNDCQFMYHHLKILFIRSKKPKATHPNEHIVEDIVLTKKNKSALVIKDYMLIASYVL